ncbi:MAG TPA: flagellar protein FlgN [Homoserinimonas sp.]|nr:flagellar protein FlgN [Homoserinimonas sp.]
MGANELSAALWRERELLDLLVFKLEEEQLLLAAGKARWLQFATREVEQVMDRLRTASLARTVEVSSVAREWGTGEDATLRELVEHAPEGAWAELFTAHLAAMSELTAQITELRDLNEKYLRSAIRSSQETLAGPRDDAGLYNSSGTSGGTATGARLFDQSV